VSSSLNFLRRFILDDWQWKSDVRVLVNQSPFVRTQASREAEKNWYIDGNTKYSQVLSPRYF
jgi:hypothetical protein